MKKTLSVICLIIVLSVLLSTVCFAAEPEYDTLADWDLKVAVPEGTTAVLKGNCYYIYAQKAGYIPYVMITTYNYESGDKFISDFTAYMQKQYKDLKVTAEAEEKLIGNKNCTEIDYSYSVSAYEVKDRRIITVHNGTVYMFASKEIEKRGETIGDMLDRVVAECVFLSEEPEDLIELPEEQPGLAEEPAEETGEPSVLELLNAPVDAYIYTQDDGMLKYWIDLTGTISDDVVLHCWFRSGDPIWHEKLYILKPDMDDIGKSVIEVSRITDLEGNDITDSFKKLKVRTYDDHITMVVKRDKKTLAGGGDDNILTGNYRMEPALVSAKYEYRNDSGMLKYWLDTDGDDIKLHAMFRSGDPEYYEEVFTFDGKTAEKDGDYTLKINNVYSGYGEDVSGWFKSLTLTEAQGAVVMSVKRDENTLAGGAEDNILTGTYMFEPRSCLRPVNKGPYKPEELAEWARIKFFCETGFFTPLAEAEKNADGTITIHLYEIVEASDIPAHTATYAWYTVDEYGNGVNDITGDAVSLFP